jgi:hypothetical protein
LRHETFKEYVGKTVGKGDNEMALLQALNTNTPIGREALIALQNWAPSTLRLYLKIIISYEKEHNDNDALNRCKLCIKFAETMMHAFVQVGLGNKNKKDTSPAQFIYDEDAPSNNSHILQYLGLLFEPLFAYAWLLEKNSHTSANSFQVLDDGIKNFNTVLDADNCQAQYGYVQSQWYKKLGDLCFYKGYAKKAGKLYVEEAQKYYAKSARILSNYLRCNIETDSNGKADVDTFQKALLQHQYPADFCLSVAECIGDLSESILAQITPDKLFDDKVTGNLNIGKPYEDTAKKLVQDIDQWFFHSSKDENTCILDWLAKCEHIDNERFASLSVQKQFDLALDLSLASSFYLLRAGQVEGAAREAIQTIEIIAQYCNWFWFRTITQRRPKNYLKYYPVLQEAVKKVIWFSKYLYWLLIEVRPKVDNKKSNSYLMGDLIPSSALTAVCSIGLSLSMFRVRQNYLSPMIRKRVGNCVYDIAGIIKKWTGSERPELDPAFKPNKYRYFPDLYDYFENKLIYSLQRHRYPVLNQLNALKILVDASLMRWSLFKDEDAIKNTHDWLEELYQINKKYNHPLHFTPMQIGLSCYLYAHMQKNKPDNKLIEFRSFDLHAETRQRLVQSLDMAHMGRGYYQAIEKLYYLYDDFNDNQIHRYHALQMAGMELTRTSLGNIWELDVRYEKF